MMNIHDEKDDTRGKGGTKSLLAGTSGAESILKAYGEKKSIALNDEKSPFHLLQVEPKVDEANKQNLCIEILVNGYVNSFVDFFYLTHRSDDAAREVPQEHLKFISENLTLAEKAHRRGQFSGKLTLILCSILDMYI